MLFRSEKRTNASYIIVAHEELVRGLHAPYVKNEIIYVYIPFIKNEMSRSVFWRIDRSGFQTLNFLCLEKRLSCYWFRLLGEGITT